MQHSMYDGTPQDPSTSCIPVDEISEARDDLVEALAVSLADRPVNRVLLWTWGAGFRPNASFLCR